MLASPLELALQREKNVVPADATPHRDAQPEQPRRNTVERDLLGRRGQPITITSAEKTILPAM